MSRRAIFRPRNVITAYIHVIGAYMASREVSKSMPARAKLTVISGSVTIKEAFADFLRDCQSTLEENTCAYYKHQLTQLIRWLDERDVALCDVRARDIREYIGYRQEKGLSQKSRRHDALCAKVFLKFCHREGYIESDPLKDYQIPRAPEAYVRMPTAAELRSLLQAVKDVWTVSKNPNCRYHWTDKDRRFFRERDFALFVTLIDTGARISELLDLKVPDYKPDIREIHIRESKGDKPRHVPITSMCVKVIADYHKAAGKACHEYVFANMFGERTDYGRTGRAFRRYMAFAGLEGFTIHGIRHYAGTQLAKTNPLGAQQILGHRDLKTVMKYVHRDADHVRDVHTDADSLGQVLVNVRSDRSRKKRTP